MRITPFDLYLRNLEEKISLESLYYMPKEEAYLELKKLTGQDFGFKVKTWKKWGSSHKKQLRIAPRVARPGAPRVPGS